MEKPLAEIRRAAETFARDRNERVTTCHVIAAIAHLPIPGRELLLDRKLTTEVLLKASRVIADEPSDLVARMLQKAKDAARGGGSEALYLLASICQDRTSAACRVMAQCGTDITRLRSQSLALASGVVVPRRTNIGEARAMMDGTRSETRIATHHVPKASTPHSTARPIERPETRIAHPHRPARESEAKRVGGDHRAKKRVESPTKGATPFDLDAKKFPLLAKHAKNLTALAFTEELEPTIGRGKAVELVLDVASRKEQKNPCLVGVGGVGKSAVVREVARKFVKEATIKEPRLLLEIDPMSILAQRSKGGVDDLVGVVDEAKKLAGRVVLVVENFPSVLAMEGPEGLLQLRVGFARSEIACIGTSSTEDYRRIIEGDPVYRRLMSAVEIEEPNADEATEMVAVASASFAEHHGVAYSAEAITSSIDWAQRYVGESAMPHKALTLLDLAGARVQRRGAAEVSPEDVAAVVSEVTGVPESRLLETDGEKLLRLEALLEERVVGHKEALARISAILRRSATRIRGKRPLGSFLLLGPTGVGKTEAAKAIAECMFGSEDAMTRLDLSEYAEAHSIARLIGAPPGYVGHEAGGFLTEAVKRRPYQVVLLDEIEKAHRDVLEAFLQVFDEGRLTDGRGRTIDFTNVVIVLTSNLGADRIPRSERGRIGFGAAVGEAPKGVPDVKETLLAAARDSLPPELFNRFDEVLAFGPLSRIEVREIARRMLARLSNDLKMARGLELDMSEEAIEVLLDRGGYDLALGARPMRRAIERLVEAPLADLILRGSAREGDIVLLGVEDGELVVDALPKTRRLAG